MFEDILKQIRTSCRLAMDGVASTSMREYGLDYKLNFGLRLAQIKAIADKYEKSSDLAKLLWKENTRELKILATLLFPISEFTEDDAQNWVKGITNQEIREQICMNLFQELPFALKLSTEWIKSENDEIRATGYWLLARLLLTKKVTDLNLKDLPNSIYDDILSSNLFIRNSSLLVLKYLIRSSELVANEIIDNVKIYRTSESAIEQEAYNNLSFEKEFIWG